MKKLSFLLILAMSVTFAMAQNGRTLYDFEDGTTQGWTAIDADGDGFSWGLHAPDAQYTSDVGHNESSYYFNSASYDNDSETALSPNNFLVSPQVTLGGTITFWAQAQDPNYAAEHFGVAVSTTSATNASAFTTIQEWTMTAKSIPGVIGNHNTRSGNRTTNTWYQFTVDLSAYSGQGYVAIRHFNCTDQFILNVDDITIEAGSGGGESIIYDFEDSTTQGWTTIDADGDGYTWVLGSAIGGIYLINDASLAGSGHNASNDLMCSGSYRNLDSGGGEVLTPDNYLVSPQVALGGSIDFWACGQDASYAAEHFGVAVSTTNNTNPSAFTVLQQWTLTAKGTRYEGPRGNRDQGTWYHFTVDLSAYAGQTGYIAIRHFNISDQFILDIDDITIVEGDGSSTQTYTITATPNPLEGGYITIAYRGDRDRQSYDFEDGAQGWTSIDADGDGYGWDSHINTGTGNYTAHAGDGLMTSASYINDIGALTPDNYLVSPQVQLGGSITFYACAQDASYAAEHFGVAVSTTSNTNASAFTTLQEWTMTAKNGGVPTNYTRSGNGMSRAYYEYTVDLSAYAGQTGYVAIRHFDCTDQFYLNVDDITINEGGSGGQTGETVTGEFNEGQTCILTAIPFTGYHFVNWTENGTVVSTNAVYSFTVDSNRNLVANFSDQSTITYTITATPNPLEGGYITIDYRGNRDVVFSDDFETGISNWTLIDADGDGQNWYDLIDDNPNNIPGHNGSAGFATSASYSDSALTPDNYLVSPQVALNGTFSFWACAQDNSWAAEHFGVAVSTTNNTNAAAFTTIQEWTLTAKSGSGVFTNDTRDGTTRDQGSWYQYTVDLSAYAGQTGYIAIRHFNCTDMFRIVVDDVELTTSGGSQTGETVSAVFDEGQTCILTATPFDGYYFVNWTENGTEVSTSNVYTFEVTSDRTLFANFSTEVVENYNVNVMASPATGGTVTGGGEYAAGASCTVTATPAEGYTFVNWAENGTVLSTDPSYTFTVNENHTLVANFTVQSYTITLTANPTEGGTLTGGGTYNHGQYCTAVATEASGYTFVNWTEDGTEVSTDASYYFMVEGNRNLVANFTINSYTVTVAANPTEGGTVTGDGTFTYGDDCTVSATEAEGYTFINWTENGSFVSSELTFTFTVEADRDLVANFSTNPQPMHTITVIANPAEGGTVVGGGTYEEGQACTVTATPAAGYTFINWTENDEEVSAEASFSFTVTSDRTLIANFSIESYEIVATTDPAEGGTVTGTGTYDYGTEITLSVILNEDYSFEYWTENGLIVSYDPDYTFTVTGNRSLLACLKYTDGIGENTISFGLYPNPVSDMLNVEATEAIEQVDVFTITGSRVFSEKGFAEKVQINTTDMPAGTYVIRMTTKNASEVRTFVKF